MCVCVCLSVCVCVPYFFALQLHPLSVPGGDQARRNGIRRNGGKAAESQPAEGGGGLGQGQDARGDLAGMSRP